MNLYLAAVDSDNMMIERDKPVKESSSMLGCLLSSAVFFSDKVLPSLEVGAVYDELLIRKEAKKSMLRLLPVSDDVAIFLAQLCIVLVSI